MRSDLFKSPCIALMANVLTASPAFAADVAERTVVQVGNTGAYGIWILANVSFAGMRAQGNRSHWWRFFAFIFGFPGTLVTYLAVDEGSDRAYGIDLPKRRD